MPVPAMAGKRTYAITVANNGPGEATNVPVALKVDGVVVGSAKIDLLPAQESSLAQIVGPQCAFTVRAVADPDKQIRETDESDNAFTLPCAQVTS
jgi:subtilase family serine protease